MSRQLAYTDLTQTLAWIWAGFLAAGFAGWLAYKYWRRGHPPAHSAPQRSYSQRLQQRLAIRRGSTKGMRRGGSVKSHPRRH